MKSDNEPTISLPVYFKSVKKNENMFAKITENKNKRTQKKGKKSFYRRESNVMLCYVMLCYVMLTKSKYSAI